MVGLQLFDNLQIQSSFGSYPVKFCAWLGSVKNVIERGDVVLIDRKVATLYPAINKLEHKKIVIDASENAKTYESIGLTINEILSGGFTTKNKLVAIGGGITQDITAFSASILLRGVDWIFFPTNLLSQCDSCIGSKTSVNLGVFKNQLGGFYPPKAVYVDTAFCASLSNEEIASGLGEMMHYLLIDGSVEIDELFHTVKKAKLQTTSLERLIKKSLLIKKTVIEIDEFDVGPRRIFNYGHTFGHALEAVTNYKIPHGIAVAYGMDLANYLSAHYGYVNIKFRNSVRPILEEIWGEIGPPVVDVQDYLAALKRDKKNVDGFFCPILTRGLGDMFQARLEFDSKLQVLLSEYFTKRIYEKSI
jgi:3-dehydroquinate synthase